MVDCGITSKKIYKKHFFDYFSLIGFCFLQETSK